LKEDSNDNKDIKDKKDKKDEMDLRTQQLVHFHSFVSECRKP